MEVCKRFLSDDGMGGIERLEIVKCGKTKYFIHCGVDDDGFCSSLSGNSHSLDNLDDAVKMLKKHRPNAVEEWWYLGIELNVSRLYLAQKSPLDKDNMDAAKTVAHKWLTDKMMTEEEAVDEYLLEREMGYTK